MKQIEPCPVCGGELVRKPVEKLLRGGGNTATITVTAEVCHRCGERLYEPETVRLFEELRGKLERGETNDFVPLGRSYEVRRAS